MQGSVTSDSISFFNPVGARQYHLHFPSKNDPPCIYAFTGEFDMNYNSFSDVLEMMQFW
jgi:hypothetical protein